jgi:hypothetical protein
VTISNSIKGASQLKISKYQSPCFTNFYFHVVEREIAVLNHRWTGKYVAVKSWADPNYVKMH